MSDPMTDADLLLECWRFLEEVADSTRPLAGGFQLRAADLLDCHARRVAYYTGPEAPADAAEAPETQDRAAGYSPREGEEFGLKGGR